MRLPSLLSLAGFIALAASTWSPLLRPFHIFNYDVYGLNKAYGVVILIVAVLGVLALVLQQAKLARISAIVSLLLVAALYAAAILKVNSSFSFIPFKSISQYLSAGIKFKWGWWLMFGGAIVALLGAVNIRTKLGIPQVEPNNA